MKEGNGVLYELARKLLQKWRSMLVRVHCSTAHRTKILHKNAIIELIIQKQGKPVSSCCAWRIYHLFIYAGSAATYRMYVGVVNCTLSSEPARRGSQRGTAGRHRRHHDSELCSSDCDWCNGSTSTVHQVEYFLYAPPAAFPSHCKPVRSCPLGICRQFLKMQMSHCFS
jgi:hypothetical protein